MDIRAESQHWGLTLAQLSHTPMSKEGGSSQANSIREVRRNIDRPAREFDMRREQRALAAEKRRRKKIEARLDNS